MDSQQKRKEIKDLIDNIKMHSDFLSEKPTVPLLEVSVILSKISRLHEKTTVLKYLLSVEQNIQDDIRAQHIEEHEEKLEAEVKEKMKGSAKSEEPESNFDEEAQITESAEEDSQEHEVQFEQEDDSESDSTQGEIQEDETTEEVTQVQESEEVTEESAVEEEPDKAPSLEEIEAAQEISSKPDLNEQFTEEEDPSLSEQLKKQPIADLLTAIGLNERYLYANELFGGDIDDFRKVIRTLNEFENGSDAIDYFNQELMRSYGWEKDNELVQALLKLVERRY